MSRCEISWTDRCCGVATVVMTLTSQLFLLLQWTKEDGHRTSTSAVPNLFVPLNTNPKEVQEMRNKVRAALGTWRELGAGLEGCLLPAEQCALPLVK